MRNVNIAERSWRTDERGGAQSEGAKRAKASDPVSASFLSYSSYTFAGDDNDD